MKNKRILFLLCIIFSLGLMLQCEKLEPNLTEETDDSTSALKSGKPEGRGNKNPRPGVIKGDDYGDLYYLFRLEQTENAPLDLSANLEINGIPNIIEVAGEYYVIPMDEEGHPISRYSDESVFLDNNDDGVFDVENDYYLEEMIPAGEEDTYAYGDLTDGEAAQEVDFGRLNLVRSPDGILNQALNDVVTVLNNENAVITQDYCGRLFVRYFYEEGDPEYEQYLVDGVELPYFEKIIDSPRENMAIYRAIMRGLPVEDDGSNEYLLKTLIEGAGLDPLMVAAAAFAGGSDKTGFVDSDEVAYINGFMECTGLDPINIFDVNGLNEETDIIHGFPKLYYNFEDFRYYREATFENRWIEILDWGGVISEQGEGEDINIFNLFELLQDSQYDGYGIKPEFTHKWSELPTETDDYGKQYVKGITGFALAADDAVQVLEYVHSDTYINFLPDGPYPEEE